MAENYALFISTTDLIPNSQIRQAADGAKVRFFAEDEGHTEHADWVRFEVRWPDGTARVTRRDRRDPELPRRLREVCTEIAGREDAGDSQKSMAHHKIARSRNVLELCAPPECAEKLRDLACNLARHTDALLLCEGVVRDSGGRLCIGAEGDADADAGWDIPPSAIARKSRSEERLRRHGLEPDETAPAMIADEEGLVRPPWETARRACALVTVAARAEGLEQQRAIQFLQGWGLWDAASPLEQAFLLNPTPPEPDRIQFLWRYEGLWALLWTLNHVEQLALLDSVCDVRRAVKIVTGTPTDGFIARSQLRPVNEILDETDFIYRCHRLVVKAHERGEAAPGGLEPGVVLERHRALEWITCHHGQEWDAMTMAL